MRKTYLLILSVPLLFLASCSKNIEIDNPRPEEVMFVVDGTEIKVPASSQSATNLAPGKHTVKILGHEGVVFADTTFEVKEGGLLHSGYTEYISWRQLYGLQNDRKTLLNEKWLTLDSVKVHGDFKVYPKEVVFLEKKWETGVDEDLPKESTLYITSDFVIKSKLFRVEDFIETYRQLSKGNQ